MKNNNNRSAMKAGVGYTIGNIFIKGIGFLTLPLFSRLMTTDEFGIYNVFISYESFLYVIIGCAIHSSIRSANLEFRGKISEYTSSVSIIYLINFVILSMLSLVFGKSLSSITGFSVPIILMLVLYSFGSALLALYNNKISLEYQYKQYLIVAFCNSIGNVLLSLLLMYGVFKINKEYGRIMGTTLTLAGISVFLLISLYRKAKPEINKSYWRFAIKYSLPIVPHGISQVLLAQFDRIMIQQMVGNAEAGIYSLAGNIKLILTIIIDSVMNSWCTWFYEKIDIGEVKEIQKRAKQICGIFVVLAIGLMAISPEMILILGGKSYDAGKYVAIPMIMDAFIIFLYNMVVLGEYYTKNTNYIMWMTLLAAVLNVMTNYIFIGRYGFVAAAYTTLFSYFVYLVLHTIASYKLLKFFVLPVKWMIGYILLSAISCAVCLIFVNNIIIRYLICLIEITPIVLWLARGNSSIVNRIIKKKEV